MTYDDLIAEHVAIQYAAAALVQLTAGPPRPDAAAQMLERLSELVRDHLINEDPIVYATSEAVRGSRHDAAVVASVAFLEELKENWAAYIYRWDRAQVEQDWRRFGAESATMMGRLLERVGTETSILYSLALHHGLLEPNS